MNDYPIFSTRNAYRTKSPTQAKAFNQHYFIYTSQLVEFGNVLEEIKEIMFQEQVWPDQCDYVIYKVYPFRQAANNIASSIKKQGNKPSRKNHYSLLVSAYYFNDQVEILIDSVREYREFTDQQSARKSKQKTIVTSLHGLESSLKDLIKELGKELGKQKVM